MRSLSKQLGRAIWAHDELLRGRTVNLSIHASSCATQIFICFFVSRAPVEVHFRSVKVTKDAVVIRTSAKISRADERGGQNQTSTGSLNGATVLTRSITHLPCHNCLGL
jgi:hypothetical protein